MKYQNFFSFQDVTYAYPPHAVNVPFISSHIKVSRSSLEPNLTTWQFYFPCRPFLCCCCFFFFTWSWIQFFFKEILLVIRNVCITVSETELVFRRVERRCSGSLFSMLIFKKIVFDANYNQYLLNKKDDTNIPAWIELSLWRCKRCYGHLMLKFVSTRDYLIPPIAFAFLNKREPKKAVHRPISLTTF